MKNTLPWIFWLVFTTGFTLSTRNPIYLVVLLICLFTLGAHIAKRKQRTNWFSQTLKFILTMIGISALINTLFTHLGSTIMFSFPENWLLIGGNITLESLAYGVINGMIIGVLFLVFNILNLALSIKQFTHLIPRIYYPIAMTVTISLTFFPSIQQRSKEIKEAQQLRGNAMKKIKDWIPLFIPLLISSLENATRLSESLTARGFQAQTSKNHTSLALLGFFSSTFLVFSGWIIGLYHYPKYLSILLYGIGGITLLTTIFLSNRNKITRYQKDTLKKIDIFWLVFYAVALINLILLRTANNLDSLIYTVYPKFSMPEVEMLALLLNISPVFPILRSYND
jgi:energy-coupling factor transport system permease protein